MDEGENMNQSKARCEQPIRPFEMDEMLEVLWTQAEKSDFQENSLIQVAATEGLDESSARHWLDEIVKAGLGVVRDGQAHLTPQGEEEAKSVIRRHRLAERLFADVFKTSEEVWEKEACQLEHESVLTAEAVNAVCSFLGHPPHCPHGRSIPPGDCCQKFTKEIKPFVIPLSEATLSEHYRIAFITPKHHNRLAKLSSIGILPGSYVVLQQKKPAYVLHVGQTEVALDGAIVDDIYVKRVD